MADHQMPTWIFLRGLTREAAHWGTFAEVFRASMPGARVMALDLPGNGQFHAMPSPSSISEMVNFCRLELARRSKKPPFYLLAMSLGAMVAAEWSAQAPQEVAGCVLINTSLRPFSAFYQRLRPRNYAPLLRLALCGATPAVWERTVRCLTSNDTTPREELIADWVTIRLAHPVRAGNALRQLLAAARYRADTQPPATRVLLLASVHDRLVSVTCSRSIAARWGYPLALHPWAGHDLALDDPAWVARQVRQWLVQASKESADD